MDRERTSSYISNMYIAWFPPIIIYVCNIYIYIYRRYLIRAISGNVGRVIISRNGDEGHRGLEVSSIEHGLFDELLKQVDLGGHVWV